MNERIMKFFFTSLLCLLVGFPVLAQQQPAPRAKASLAGTLTKYGSGEPIRNAEISVSRSSDTTQVTLGINDSSDSQQITVVTDRSGHFQFPSLAPGDYSLVVHKNGFHGFRGPNSHTWQEFLNVTLTPGQAMTDLALEMQPGAVIAGKVTDEEGEPMAYVQVGALKWVYASHRRQLRPVGASTTDDQGNYRIFSLEPGSYIVRASTAAETGGSKLHYAPDYYPDTTSPLQASPITLRPGDEQEADFRLTRVRAAKVSGHIAGGSLPGQTQIYLRNTEDEGLGMMRAGGTSVDKDGNFTIDGVLPGDYMLGAVEFRGDNNDNPQHAELPIKVEGEDVSGVSLTLGVVSKASMQGMLRIDGADVQHPRLDSLRIGLLPADDATANDDYVGAGGYTPIARNGMIHMDRISPGRYVVSITADGDGWEDFYTKSVEIGNRDVTDSVVNFTATSGVVPITVTVAIDGAYVEGTVTDDQNKPVANATVIGVPEVDLRNQFDLYQRAETDQNGHFRLRGIKPGSYSFYAWNSMEDESYMDPEFLRRYENERVDLTLTPKDRQTLQLKLLSSDQ